MHPIFIPSNIALRIRLFSSPFIFSDEGLSFGGSCPGFDASGCPGQKVEHFAGRVRNEAKSQQS